MGTKAVLIAGPTASGKSRHALSLARRHDGVVINADSMQVYAEFRVLTARPDPAEERAVPHRLYGYVPAARRFSVGAWLEDIATVIEQVRGEGGLPIVVGGTGLYFKALCEGLVAVPPIPAEVREEVQRLAEGETSAGLHRRLAEVDPDDARRIRPSDRARILRALEVFTATGRSLASWLEQPARPLLDVSAIDRFVLDPERADLHRRIAERAETMIGDGAIAEVEALLAQDLSPELPAMKAIGVRQLGDYLAGKRSLDQALADMSTDTRRYAKRQMTWFRHQMADWLRFSV